MEGGRERSGVLLQTKMGFDEESLEQILQEYYMTAAPNPNNEGCK